MPSPSALGLSSNRRRAASSNVDARPGPSFDWTDIRKRLQKLGAVGFNLERLRDGSYRFTCRLATTALGTSYPIEATGSTEEQAVRLVLQRAEEWKLRR